MSNTTVLKVDSNITQTSYCVETASAIGVLPIPSTQNWVTLEPNSYKDIGGKIKTVARQPINASRQLRKGVLVDEDAMVGFSTDMTQTNMQDLLQGFFFANYVRKSEVSATPIAGLVPTAAVSTVTGTNTINFTASIPSTSFRAGDLIFTSGFTNVANNGLLTVSSATATGVTVTQTLVNETPPSTSQVVQVGFQFTAGDVSTTTSGSYPAITATSKNLTQFGLSAGEFVFIGGDTAATQFATSSNLGYARVFSTAAGTIQFDKTFGTFVADNGSTKTVQVFFGRVLFNQQPANIVRRTYTIENQLGFNNANSTGLQQSQYIPGCVPNEFTLNVKEATKLTCDLDFIGLHSATIDENVTGANTLLTKAAVAAGGFITQPSLGSAAYNLTSDVPRLKLATYAAGAANPTPLFAYCQDLTLTVKNNITADKAVGVLGAFEMTAGFFEISGKTTTYFQQVEEIQTVLSNGNVTLDFHMTQNNAGFSVDLPLLTLGDGLPKIEINKPITMDFDMMFASGNFVNPNLDYTAKISFYDYLPSLAQTI